jgi:hypothetical protein
MRIDCHVEKAGEDATEEDCLLSEDSRRDGGTGRLLAVTQHYYSF